MAKQTDNHDPSAKLALRRYFIDKYHSDGLARVLDCCQGGGLLWSELRKTHSVASYWGLDLKPKKGRLKLDSVRVLTQTGWNQNVIDIDTYGSPWKHWQAMLPNVTQPTTVFLTIGATIQGGFVGKPPTEVMRTLSLPKSTPNSLMQKVAARAVSALLTAGYDRCTIIEAVEAVSDGNARYIGIRLEPINAKGPESLPPSLAERNESVEETSHV